MPLTVGVLASGRGSNFAALHDAIRQGALAARIAVLLSDVADAPALARARERGVPAVHVEPAAFAAAATYEARLARELAEREVELVCLAGYMRILGPEFVRRFAGRVMNIHPSLLPSFPGLHAQRQALDYGVKIAGCTVHFVDEGVDTGPIILQAPVPVQAGDSVETLSARILAREHVLYPRAVALYGRGALRLEGRLVRITDPEESEGGWA